MGWDSLRLDGQMTVAKAVKFLKNDFREHEFIEVKAVKADKYDECKYVLYAALRKNGETFGCVFLVNWTNYNSRYTNASCDFSYKVMEEGLGPFYYDCPESVLDKLSPTDNERALRWREACRKTNEAKVQALA
jgi:hypothetical protein